jgi:hypothetical protein
VDSGSSYCMRLSSDDSEMSMCIQGHTFSRQDRLIAFRCMCRAFIPALAANSVMARSYPIRDTEGRDSALLLVRRRQRSIENALACNSTRCLGSNRHRHITAQPALPNMVTPHK